MNKNAPVVCEKSIVLQTSPAKVWEILSDIDQWSRWQKDIPYSRLNGSLEPGSSFDWKSGGFKIRSLLHTAEAGQRLGWSGSSAGIYAIHNWTLSERDGHTLLSVSESMEGFLASVFRNSLNKKLESGLDAWLMYLREALN